MITYRNTGKELELGWSFTSNFILFVAKYSTKDPIPDEDVVINEMVDASGVMTISSKKPIKYLLRVFHPDTIFKTVILKKNKQSSIIFEKEQNYNYKKEKQNEYLLYNM